MNLVSILRFLHILSAIVLISGLVARQLTRSLAKKTDDVRTFATLTQSANLIESTMVIPGSMAVFLFGVVLGLVIGAPILGFFQGAAKNWLLVSNVLLVLVFLLAIPLIFVPKGKVFDRALEQALLAEEITPELRSLVDDRVVRTTHAVEIAVVVLVLWLMVAKPF